MPNLAADLTQPGCVLSLFFIICVVAVMYVISMIQGRGISSRLETVSCMAARNLGVTVWRENIPSAFALKPSTGFKSHGAVLHFSAMSHARWKRFEI